MDIKGLVKIIYLERLRDKVPENLYRFDRISGEYLEEVLRALFSEVGAWPYIRNGKVEIANWVCNNCSVFRFSRCSETFGSSGCFDKFAPVFFGMERDGQGDFLTGLKGKIF